MEHKQWNFKVPGDPEGQEILIGTDEIISVYDLLDRLRNNGPQAAQKSQSAQPKPKAALLPFISRKLENRRHPSA